MLCNIGRSEIQRTFASKVAAAGLIFKLVAEPQRATACSPLLCQLSRELIYRWEQLNSPSNYSILSRPYQMR